jgi:hypothetical protein
VWPGVGESVGGHLLPMDHALEMASFRGNDLPILVQASLACRACLSGQVAWALSEHDAFEPQVEISCRECGYRRSVSLTGDQALRLALDGCHS